MPKTRPPYPPQLRARLIELTRSGRSPEELGRQFEPSGQTIRNWLRQADRDEGRREDGLTTEERAELRRLRRENKPLREERDILKKPRPGSRGRPARSPAGFEFVRAHQAAHRIATVCRVLGVSPSGYYAWQSRPRSARAQADAALTEQIRTIHDRSRGTYGAPGVHAELAAQGIRVGRKRVARLMQAAGLAGVSRRAFVTTTPDPPSPARARSGPAGFTADGPNRLWVADITYIPTWTGFLYPRGRPRRLESPRGRLGDGDPSPHRAGSRRAEMAMAHGGRAT